MRKNIDVPKEKLKELVEQFYSYFDDGYAFEEFLKVYLEKIGLDEVTVTQRSSDGGIDLQAVRYGVGSLDGLDSVDYYIQAKRYKTDNTIPIEKVRALRGVIPSGGKGIFITTARFSKKTEDFAEEDSSRPIVLIDGKKLVESCIDNEIGFVFTPVFSKVAMDSFKESSEDSSAQSVVGDIDNAQVLIIEKQISSNDIRARILRIPKAIIRQVDVDAATMKIKFGISTEKELNIAKTRDYLGGVTELYRKNGLILDDGAFCPKKAIWKYCQDKIVVDIKELS